MTNYKERTKFSSFIHTVWIILIWDESVISLQLLILSINRIFSFLEIFQNLGAQPTKTNEKLAPNRTRRSMDPWSNVILSIFIAGPLSFLSLKLSDISSFLCKSTVSWTLYLITNTVNHVSFIIFLISKFKLTDFKAGTNYSLVSKKKYRVYIGHLIYIISSTFYINSVSKLPNTGCDGSKSHRMRHVSREVICMRNRDGSVSKWLKISITCLFTEMAQFLNHLDFFRLKKWPSLPYFLYELRIAETERMYECPWLLR